MERLVDEPSQVTGFGNVDVLGHTVVEQHTYTARDDTSMRGVASRVSPSFRQVMEGWKKLSLLLRLWPGRMLRRTLTLAVGKYCGFLLRDHSVCVWHGLTGLEVLEVD